MSEKLKKSIFLMRLENARMNEIFIFNDLHIIVV